MPQAAERSIVCRELEYEDVWDMFGEGRHASINKIFEQRLAPFMTQASYKFWQPRLWYFKQGLYYQGGMVRLVTTPAVLSSIPVPLGTTMFHVPASPFVSLPLLFRPSE